MREHAAVASGASSVPHDDHRCDAPCWDALPLAAWSVVFGHLPVPDVLACRLACSTWKSVAEVMLHEATPGPTNDLQRLASLPNLKRLNLHVVAAGGADACEQLLRSVPPLQRLTSLKVAILTPTSAPAVPWHGQSPHTTAGSSSTAPPAAPAAPNIPHQPPPSFAPLLRNLRQLSIPDSWLQPLVNAVDRPLVNLHTLACFCNTHTISEATALRRAPSAAATTLPLIPTFSNLRHLAFTHHLILHRADFDQIVQLTALTTLTFHLMHTLHESFTRIVTLPNLRQLTMEDCGSGLATTLLPRLTALTTLNHLDLQDSIPANLSAESVAALSSLTRLTHLDLRWSCFSSASARRQLPLSFLPLVNLVNLHLDGCDRLKASALQPLSALTGLLSLSVAQCDRLHVNHVPLPLTLTALDVSWNKRVTDSLLRDKVAPLTRLQSLALGRCSAITPRGLWHLHPLTRLRSLDLHRTVSLKLTDSDLPRALRTPPPPPLSPSATTSPLLDPHPTLPSPPQPDPATPRANPTLLSDSDSSPTLASHPVAPTTSFPLPPTPSHPISPTPSYPLPDPALLSHPLEPNSSHPAAPDPTTLCETDATPPLQHTTTNIAGIQAHPEQGGQVSPFPQGSDPTFQALMLKASCLLAALRSWRCLRKLDMWGCSVPVSITWPIITSHLTDLTDLSLRLCPHLPPAHDLAQISRLTALTALDLSHTPLAAPPALAALAAAPALHTLHLEDCRSLADDALPELSPAARLSVLDIRGCPAVSMVGVRELLRRCSAGVSRAPLSRVLLSVGGGLEVEDVGSLAEEYPHLRLYATRKNRSFAHWAWPAGGQAS